MKKRILSLCVALVMMLTTLSYLPFDKLKASAAETMDVYTIGDFTALSYSGLMRSSKMDRQCMGFILPSGSTITIQQTNPNYKQAITIQFLNNGALVNRNSKGTTETSATIPANGSAVTVSNTNVSSGKTAPYSVPFIVSPPSSSNGAKPVLAYTVNGTKQTLPYYKEGVTNQSTFLSTWKTSNAPFAVYESDYVTFLSPSGDRTSIENIINKSSSAAFKSMTELFKFYEDMIKFYDNIAGLSYDAKDPWNKNVHSKWFVKCDVVSGLGLAYYDSTPTGTVSHSVASSMTTLAGGGFLAKNWAVLHEFGHGYQGGIFTGDGAGMYFGEVWNNIYADMYQRTFSTKLWAFNNTDRAAYDTRMYNFRLNGTSYDSMGSDVRNQLLVLVLLRESIGIDAYTHLIQEYRKLCYNSKTAVHTDSADFLVRYLSEGSGYNVAPYFSAYQENASGLIVDSNYATNKKGLYFLSDLVTNSTTLTTLKNKHGLSSIHSPVATEMLKDDGIKGSAKITLSIDDFSQLSGKTLNIRDGSRVVYTTTVTSSTINVSNIPIGMYTIDIPYANGYSYYIDGSRDIVIKDGATTNVTIKLTQGNSKALADDGVLNFVGRLEKLFGTATLNLNTKQLEIETLSTAPNYGFSGTYASIRVTDASGNLVYNHLWDAKSTTNVNVIGKKTCKIDYGYKLEIYHAEYKSRFKVMSQLTGKQDTTTTLNGTSGTFEVTQYGLKRTGVADSTMKNNALTKMSNAATYARSLLSSTALSNPAEIQNLRYKMMGAVYTMPVAEQAALITKYNDILLIDSSDAVAISMASEVTLTQGTAKDIPYTVSANSPTVTATAALPTGITLDTVNKKLVVSSSVKEGTYTVTLKATGTSKTATATVKIIVEGQPVSISMASEVTVQEGVAKDIPYTISANSPTVTATTTLPTGITLDTANKKLVVSNSVKAGTYTVTLEATGTSKTATATVKITVAAEPVSISLPAEVSIAQGTAKDIAYTTSENSPTVTAAATLPTGITLDTVNKKLVVSSSVAAGTYTVTLNAAGKSQTASATVVITVADATPFISQVGDVVIPIGSSEKDIYSKFKASDIAGNTAAFTISKGAVDYNTEGTYEITLRAAIAATGKYIELPVSVEVVISQSYAGDMEMSKATSDWREVTADKNSSNGTPIQVRDDDGNAVIYAKGISAHASSEIEYDLTSLDYTHFRSYIGVDMLVGTSNSSVIFQVYLDGEEVYNSELMRITTPKKFIEIPLGSASTLKLVVDKTSDGNGNDHSNWADAMFVKRTVTAGEKPILNVENTTVAVFKEDSATVTYQVSGTPAPTVEIANASQLPAAITLDTNTKTISIDSSKIDSGTYTISLKATNENGTASKNITVIIGEVAPVGDAVFKVDGNLAYHTAHGVEEVEPIFIENGRAFVAVREAAQAVGVAAKDIVYDVDDKGIETVELTFKYKDKGVSTGYKVKFTVGSREVVFLSLDGKTTIGTVNIADDTQVMRYSTKNPDKLYLPARVLSKATSLGGSASYVHIEYCANENAETSDGKGDFVCYTKADSESSVTDSKLNSLIDEAVSAFEEPKD